MAKPKNRSLERRSGASLEQPTFAIVCEGKKTEIIYFEGVRTALRLASAKVIVEGLGADPLTVVKRAESYLPDVDHVWAVFDVEAPQPHPSLLTAIEYAERKKVRVAVSNPCFELWLLLHFQDQSAYLDTATANAHIKRCQCSYTDKGFDFAATWPHQQAARDRAARLVTRQLRDHPEDVIARNPWTSVHELMALIHPVA